MMVLKRKFMRKYNIVTKALPNGGRVNFEMHAYSYSSCSSVNVAIYAHEEKPRNKAVKS